MTQVVWTEKNTIYWILITVFFNKEVTVKCQHSLSMCLHVFVYMCLHVFTCLINVHFVNCFPMLCYPMKESIHFVAFRYNSQSIKRAFHCEIERKSSSKIKLIKQWNRFNFKTEFKRDYREKSWKQFNSVTVLLSLPHEFWSFISLKRLFRSMAKALGNIRSWSLTYCGWIDLFSDWIHIVGLSHVQVSGDLIQVCFYGKFVKELLKVGAEGSPQRIATVSCIL